MPKFILSCLLIVLIVPSLSLADLYRYIDEEGIISFTNDLTFVPEPFRDSAELIRDEELPSLGLQSAIPSEPPEKSSFSIPPFNPMYIWAFVILIILSIVAFRIAGGGALIKGIFTVIFISLIGTTIYSLILTKGMKSKDGFNAESIGAELRKVSPTHRAQDAVDQLNKQQEQQQEMIQILHGE